MDKTEAEDYYIHETFLNKLAINSFDRGHSDNVLIEIKLSPFDIGKILTRIKDKYFTKIKDVDELKTLNGLVKMDLHEDLTIFDIRLRKDKELILKSCKLLKALLEISEELELEKELEINEEIIHEDMIN